MIRPPSPCRAHLRGRRVAAEEAAVEVDGDDLLQARRASRPRAVASGRRRRSRRRRPGARSSLRPSRRRGALYSSRVWTSRADERTSGGRAPRSRPPARAPLVVRDVVDRDVDAAFRERERDARGRSTASRAAPVTSATLPSSSPPTLRSPPHLAVVDPHLVCSQADLLEGDAAGRVGTWNSSECHGQVTTSPSQIQASFQSVCGP